MPKKRAIHETDTYAIHAQLVVPGFDTVAEGYAVRATGHRTVPWSATEVAAIANVAPKRVRFRPASPADEVEVVGALRRLKQEGQPEPMWRLCPKRATGDLAYDRAVFFRAPGMSDAETRGTALAHNLGYVALEPESE